MSRRKFLPVKPEGDRKRGRKDVASLQSAILVAATSLVEEKGIAGLSMRAIAAKLHMGRTAVRT
jgi:AcrR family transcriptional regulator